MLSIYNFINERAKLDHYVNEKLTLDHYVNEKLTLNNNTKLFSYKYHPNTLEELRSIIDQRLIANLNILKNTTIDLNDIDVSKIDNFFNLFNVFRDKLYLIDISKWNTTNVEFMSSMFNDCRKLRSIGNVSKWNVSNVIDFGRMFYNCKSLENMEPYLNNWKVNNDKLSKNHRPFRNMFFGCPKTAKYSISWYKET